jgi:hypothetical protein
VPETTAKVAVTNEIGRNVTQAPKPLDKVCQIFQKWLYLPDPSALKVALGAVAANLIESDPLWLLLVGPTGSGKTQLLDPLMSLPYNMHSVGTLTQAALLSGSPGREKATDASGGLLRGVNRFGFLILKDFTTVLSTSGEVRGPLLAALREIHDGHWTRHLGVDGGRKLHWAGKCAIIGGCTPAIDIHHSVMALMGERFLLFRLPDSDLKQHAARAMEHVGQELNMQRELHQAVGALFGSVPTAMREFNKDSIKRMAALSTFVARARSAVERDPYRREIELIPDPEMPGRLARTLRLLFHGLENIGVPTEECWKLVTKVALDCIPSLRRQVLTCLFGHSVGLTLDTSAIAEAVGYPTVTTRRALEDLTGHRLVQRFEGGQGMADAWITSSLSKELLVEAKAELWFPTTKRCWVNCRRSKRRRWRAGSSGTGLRRDCMTIW